MQDILILTHGGKFHADEVSAIGLMLETFDFDELKLAPSGSVFESFSKKYPSQRLIVIRYEGDLEEIFSRFEKSHLIYILDMGRKYNPLYLQFDHHQDEKLPATNILMLDFLVSKEHIQKSLADQLKVRLFNSISDFDKGVKIINGREDNFNTMINDFGNTEFADAVNFARNVIHRKLRTCQLIVDRDKIINDFVEIYDSGIAVNKTENLVLGWQEERLFDLYICPNREPGRWSLLTYSSEYFAIPKDDFQTFRHNSGFMAVYKSVDEALLMAKQMVENRILKNL